MRIEEATRRIEEAAKRSLGTTKRNVQSTERIYNAAEGSDRITEETEYTTKRMNEDIRTLVVRRSLNVALRYLGIEIISRKRQTWSC